MASNKTFRKKYHIELYILVHLCFTIYFKKIFLKVECILQPDTFSFDGFATNDFEDVSRGNVGRDQQEDLIRETAKS